MTAPGHFDVLVGRIGRKTPDSPHQNKREAGRGPAPALLVGGTASGVGKSFVVTGLCRLLARKGLRPAPFKAQNMSNNSAVTADGAEIGRAQYAQAQAAGVEPEAAMNPVLLKPTGERTSQVVVMGRAVGTTDAVGWGSQAPDLFPVVLDALASLRGRFDMVVAEGAGGATEINLFDRDIVNLRLAAAAELPVIVVGDIERGGVFAALYGTVALLPDNLRPWVRGFVVNRFRGDPALLAPGIAELERRTGVPVLGVLPWSDVAPVDEEDSLDLGAGFGYGPLDVAVIRFPRIANVTDLDPLRAEPDVSVRFVCSAAALGRPDLIVLPGSKSTVDDLGWLRATGLADAVVASEASVLGICAGWQMLGRRIVDHVESGRGEVDGLGLLDAETVFEADKVVRRTGMGYELHHGRVTGEQQRGRVRGTSVHGLLEEDGFRRGFLAEVAAERGRPFTAGTRPFAALRQARFDAAADLLEAHLDLSKLEELWS